MANSILGDYPIKMVSNCNKTPFYGEIFSNALRTLNHMPNLNGVDMLETYKEKGYSLKETPVLMVTSECNPKV